MRKRLRVWAKRGTLAAVTVSAVGLAIGVGYEEWSRRQAAEAHPPVGTLVDVQGRRTHLHCTGEGQPTVILESGLSVGGSLDWTFVQPQISQLSRVCSYDRGGVLWSDRGPAPRDGARLAEELHAALSAASESPPFVLVGHSLGGLLVRIFTSRFEGEVVGIVFVDSSHPEQVDRFSSEVPEYPLPGVQSPLLVRFQAATGIYRLTRSSLNSGLGPESDEPVTLLQPKSVAALAAEAAVLDETLRQAGEAGDLSNTPVVVLTAGRQGRSDMSQATMVKYRRTWLTLQAELASLSTNSVQRTLEGATHYIQLVDPTAVVRAVRDVIGSVREGTELDGGDG